MRMQRLNRLASLSRIAGLLLVASLSWLTADGRAATFNDPQLTFTYAGVTRDFLIHVPSGHLAAQPAPLVISLHGAGSNSLAQQRISGFDSLSEPNNFIVIYPDSAGSDWNLSNASGGDVGFLTAIVDYLTSTGYAIDRDHMYLAGYSDGAYLAQLAVLCTPGYWAGVGMVASDFYPNMLTQCPVNPPIAKPISVLMFHGEADTFSPYDGGKDSAGRTVDSAAQTLTEWLTLDNCGPTLQTLTITDQLNNNEQVFDTLQQSTGCSGPVVELYSIPGAGHTWPGSGMSPTAKSASGIPLGPTSLDLKASSLMWSVFSTR